MTQVTGYVTDAVTREHEENILELDPLLRRQLSLEQEMLDAGVEAYRRRLAQARERGEASQAGATNELLKAIVGPFASAVRELIENARNGRPGRYHTSVAMLQGLDPEVVAFVTASVVLNGCAQRPRREQAVAMEVAHRVEDEARLEAFAKQHSQLLVRVLQRLNRETSNRDHQRIVLVHLMNKKGDDWTPWGTTHCLHLGTRLVELFMEHTGYAYKFRSGSGTKQEALKIRLDDKLLELLRQKDDALCLLAPRYYPMVVPPVPWTKRKGGGYVAGFVRPLTLIKRRGGWKGKIEGLDPMNAPDCFEAINAVQATPWRINRRLYDLLTEAYERQIKVGIPDRENEPVPATPADIDTNAEARKAWKIEARAVHLANSKQFSKRLIVTRALDVAKKFLDGVSIYFPHSFDFRGRMYAQTAFLSPQGADVSKALLEFAEGKPVSLSDQSVGWLAIHGANLFGNDKCSLEDRIDWVEERRELILRTAADPFADLWWGDADKPWQFLAWCVEWAGWLEHGEGFLSRAHVALDGSCNGLQHYSALLRDPVGGAAVNLVPADKPNDIYGRVAEVVNLRLRSMADAMDYSPQPGSPCFEGGAAYEAYLASQDPEHRLADKWLRFGIDRKLTKRPVMVLPYGGTQNACRAYVAEAYEKKVAEGTPDPFTPEERPAAISFLSRIVWDSIGEVVVAARAAMDWLRAAARVATAAGIPIRWTTPSGFPVVQAYYNLTRRRVKTRLNGQITRLSLVEETDELDGRQQANGLPPNFVHSLDAAALCRTVVTAKQNGIGSFAMVHDSYGTHAADTGKLSTILRQVFVDMYQEEDLLANFERDLRAYLPPEFADRLPPLPERGTLDLEGVLKSDFFFA